MYDAHHNHFSLEEEDREMPADSGVIYWTHLPAPDEAG
jgi:hypothetical protein